MRKIFPSSVCILLISFYYFLLINDFIHEEHHIQEKNYTLINVLDISGIGISGTVTAEFAIKDINK